MSKRTRLDHVIRLFKDDHADDAYKELTPLLEAHPNDFELHYIAGMIHGSQSCFAYAISSFRTAVSLNSKHAQSFFELGVIQMQLCRFNKAAHYFEKARSLGHAVHEATSYLSKIKRISKEKDVTLSTCLIVKNEEKHLPACLKSVQAISDEIIVVDTGSEDSTVEIATKFGAKIHHYQWHKDFAAARNFAKKQATGDWILQLDADEELFTSDQFKVREVIHQNLCDGAFLGLHNRLSSTFGEDKPAIHYLVRLYKNRAEFYYENAIHEVLQIPGKVIPVDINILHHGYNLDSDTLIDKRKRNAEILYKRLQENPDSKTTLFYLMLLHLGNKEFDLAESFGEKALKKIDEKGADQHLYLMLLNNLAIVAIENNNFKKAKEYCQKAIDLNDNYLDPYFHLGLTYFKEQEFEKAKNIFNRYLEKHRKNTKQPVFNMFASSSDSYLFQVYHLLGKIYRKEGNENLAEKMLSQAIELNQNFWIGYIDLAYLHSDRSDFQKAVHFFDEGIKIAKENPAVNESNEVLWFDFTNGVKKYIQVLKLLKEQIAPQTA